MAAVDSSTRPLPLAARLGGMGIGVHRASRHGPILHLSGPPGRGSVRVARDRPGADTHDSPNQLL